MTQVLHTITLPRIGVFLLAGMLEQPAWATTSRDHGEAFRLLDSVIPDVKQPDEMRSATTQREARRLAPDWCNAPEVFSITERQRDTIKKCLQSLMERGALPPGWGTNSVLSAFGMTDSE